MISRARIDKSGGHLECQVCEQEFPVSRLRSWASVRPGVSALIAEAHPGWADGAVICQKDLAVFRDAYVEQLLACERGELGDLERQVVQSLQSGQILSQHLLDEAGSGSTLGERAADRVAAFGGSWTFILWFTAILFVWIAANAVGVLPQPFDPYPFIFLNLILSMLAAIQAPIIMMAQNRQSDKDRVSARLDYEVNVKAESEVAWLHTRLDRIETLLKNAKATT